MKKKISNEKKMLWPLIIVIRKLHQLISEVISSNSESEFLTTKRNKMEIDFFKLTISESDIDKCILAFNLGKRKKNIQSVA